MRASRITTILLTIITVLAAQTEKINIAVLRLDPIHITEQEAQILTKKLSSELVKQGKYTVLDRGEMEAILEEQGFQQTGCTSSECAVEVGQLLGVQKIIAGSVGKLGSIFYTEIRMIDVETSRIDKTVDHNQEGSIENVLITSMPYVASQLSGGGMVLSRESLEKDDEPQLFVETDAQKHTTPTEQPTGDSQREIELISHHTNGQIYMNGQLIGTDEVTVPKTNQTVSLYEKKWFYTSKPKEVNLSTIGKSKYGVGGKYKEAVFSVAFINAGTREISLPGFEVNVGSLKQSARSNELTFIIGGMNGLAHFTDTPDTSTLGDTGTVLIGGFYAFRYEWELAEIFKFGLGFDAGFLLNQTKHLDRFYFYNFSGDLNYTFLRNDVTFISLGGPQLKTALGFRKIFLETKIRFLMGVERDVYYETDWVNDEWLKIDDIPGHEELIGNDYDETLEFAVKPVFSIGILFTL